MDDSESTPPPIQLKNDRAAGWWSWPVIVLSVITVGGSVFFESSRDGKSGSDGASTSEVRGFKASDLALMKLEGQMVIAASIADPKEARKSLEGVRDQVRGDGMVAAFLLLEDFVSRGKEWEDEGKPPSWNEEASSLRDLTERAIASGVTAEERESLEEKLGWFSELAVDQETGEVPQGASIRMHSMLVLAAVGVIFLGAVFSVLTGVTLLFLLLKKQRDGAQLLAFSKEGIPRGICLECFAIYLGTMAVGEIFVNRMPVGFSPVVYLLAVVLPLVWPLVRRVRWKEFLNSIGWHKGKGVLREVGAGFVGYTGVLAIASVGIFLTLVLVFVVTQIQSAGMTGEGKGADSSSVGPVTHPIVGWIYEGGLKERLLCLLLAAGFAPLFEEIFFRGALHRYLRGALKFFPAALITSLIFAALHPQGWMGIPALAAIGIGFSLLREWRDSLIAPMVAHAINNGVLVGLFCLAL